MSGGPAPKFRVLFVVTADWYFVSHRLDLAVALARSGFEVSVATRPGAAAAAVSAAGIRLLPVPFERSLRRPLADVRALLALHRILGAERPDAVHLVSLKPIVLGGLLLCVFHRRLRAVWAFTGMGFIFSSERRLARWLRPLLTRCLRLLNDPARVLMLVQNDDDRALLCRHRVAAPEQIAELGGAGIALERYPPTPPPVDDPPTVLLPARLLRDKGVYEFVAAAALLRESGFAARFVLAGRHDRDNHGAVAAVDLERWLEQGTVEWLGHVSDIVPQYRAATVVCLPSYREGLPRVLLEAGACGRPLVATDVPGCREVCIDERTGLLVPPRDGAALAAALKRLLGDRSMIERCGRAAHELVAANFSVEAIAAAQAALYRERLAGQAG
ncbi:MAG: glycosyltransferase family 4 protein [Gammaproteobacteria bacterium]